MEIIRNTLNEQINIPASLKDKILDKKFCFLDIETTGFSRISNYIILIGALYINGENLEIVQFFAEGDNEEKNLLDSFKSFISDFDIIITFNGDSFDIPFINSRLNHHGIKYNIKNDKGIDILKIVRRKKDLLGLQKYNLKSIERFLGIEREDTISGKESVEMYYEYIKTKDVRKKDIILRHNYEDIYNLPKILKILDIIDIKSKININTKYRNKDMQITVEIDNIKYEGSMMIMKGLTTSFATLDEVHYGDSHVFKWYPRIGAYEISLQIKNGKLSDGSKCVFTDYSIFNLPMQEFNKLDYKLPDNIIIFEHNGHFIRDNIESFIKCFWDSLFTQR
ncbi:hypothetical protein SAMN05660462_01752 [Proteiniborus ethanoligenes]|uniref:YprB ribonuclease H-like domain-containing protein n=1 Tax=Proteiniborus ethanoligenes TaxID=415015 RepID=A0A1H3Q1H9_9FIRM|nr:ribonuclease H-like domain-containing protein [Proteiniborus ethanoligenes]TAH63117.1 MAG: hypothetical protein EWM50_03810 [Gottschalkiaceae bacterium]SDZ07083.1 hypothetical protein SAMN05660462_01752 [Proteiniborus ethanoligenes]